MGVPDAQEIKSRMEAIGCLKPSAKIMLHHFSHNGGPTHDAMVEIAAENSMEVAYDGGVWNI